MPQTMICSSCKKQCESVYNERTKNIISHVMGVEIKRI